MDSGLIINLLMQSGTLLAAIATIPQIKAVVENRESLRGYNPWASFLLFLAMCFFAFGFALMENWFSVLCEVPVAVFWLIAGIYSARFRVKETV